MVTTWQVNSISSLVALVPVTSRDNGFPLHVKIAEDNPIHGFAQCEAMRAMGLDVREQKGRASIVGAIDHETLGQIMDTIRGMLALEGF